MKEIKEKYPLLFPLKSEISGKCFALTSTYKINVRKPYLLPIFETQPCVLNKKANKGGGIKKN